MQIGGICVVRFIPFNSRHIIIRTVKYHQTTFANIKIVFFFLLLHLLPEDAPGHKQKTGYYAPTSCIAKKLSAASSGAAPCTDDTPKCANLGHATLYSGRPVRLHPPEDARHAGSSTSRGTHESNRKRAQQST